MKLSRRARPVAVALALMTTTAAAETPLFRDHGDDETGLSYRRQPSPRLAVVRELTAAGELDLARDVPRLPSKPRGAPGVAILDFDGDGRLDLYVTNGPGTANSLFRQLEPTATGELRFVDVGADRGAGLADQDSTGVCYGDLDNDGDPELFVLGAGEPNRLLENRDGRFVDITAAAGIGGGARSSASCAMGDLDGDGLLDVVVANTYRDWSNALGLLVPYEHNEANRLWHNRGALRFADRAQSHGFSRLAGAPQGAAGVTWGVVVVDIDGDGDADILSAENRGAPPGPKGNHGFLHLHRNDGAGRFVDDAEAAGLTRASAWLGVSVGDLDCDGRLDLFATNAGDYPPPVLPPGVEIELGDFSSRWLLGGADGSFVDPGLGALIASPWGWGSAIVDVDHDGDLDVVYHGGFDSGFFLDAANPGVVLLNDGCSARFSLAGKAFERDHGRRAVEGLAAGDLDGDGFVDLVSVSGFDVPGEVPLTPNPVRHGSPFDATAFLVLTHRPTDRPGVLASNGYEMQPGSLAVERNRGNGNGWIAVEVRGAAGLLDAGRVNRDGVGARVTVRPAADGSPPATQAVVAGSGHASQNAPALYFGLGAATSADVEVRWPGGGVQRLRGVARGERLVVPEVPCPAPSAGGEGADDACASAALAAWTAAGVIDEEAAQKLADRLMIE